MPTPIYSCTVLYMTNLTESMFTHSNYAEATAQLKANKKNKVLDVLVWDAGDGFIGRGFYCAWRNRIITETISPSGVVIH